MNSALSRKGWKMTRVAKIVYPDSKSKYFRMDRILSIFEKWKIGYEESGDIARLTALGLIKASNNILGRTREQQEEILKQFIIRTNLMAAYMDKIELDLKQWLVKGYMGYK